MKQSIDVLGYRPDRHSAFSEQMISTDEDIELQKIVREAAAELGTPIALVNLILEHNQFFKAHFGLPAPLEAARGTTRDVSFCQYVVRDGAPFEITDAKEDERIPQHLVEHYNIRAYLGVPVVANKTVVGSLCVIDTAPRSFSEQERHALVNLGELVNQRLATLSDSTQQKQAHLTKAATSPAFQSIRQSTSPLFALADEGLLAIKSVAQFMRLLEYSLTAHTLSPKVLMQELESALAAVDICENNWLEVNASLHDVTDMVSATEQLFNEQANTNIKAVLTTSHELARYATELVGGIHLPELEEDTTLVTPDAAAVALLANALNYLAALMFKSSLTEGVWVTVEGTAAYVDIQIEGRGLAQSAYKNVRDELWGFANSDPTMRLPQSDSAFIVRFLLAI